MLFLLRKIRHQLVNSNKFSTYLLYAIGEIFLVVVGILIALQIDNWKKEKYNKKLVSQYRKALISDLKLDTARLNSNIKAIQEDFDKMVSFNKRMSSPEANFDTVYQIARHEFLGFFDPIHELNRSTVITLLSTGDINLFDEETKRAIVQHNLDQSVEIKLMDENVKNFLYYAFADNDLAFSEHPMLDETFLRGPLLDRVWSNYEPDEVIMKTSEIVSKKAVMHRIILNSKQKLIEKTLVLLEKLEKEQ